MWKEKNLFVVIMSFESLFFFCTINAMQDYTTFVWGQKREIVRVCQLLNSANFNLWHKSCQLKSLAEIVLTFISGTICARDF